METYLAHSTIDLTTPTSTNPFPHSSGADKTPVDTAVIEVQLATTTIDGAGTGIERETSLTKTQIASINKSKRRQAKAKVLRKLGTACFAPDTPILVIRNC